MVRTGSLIALAVTFAAVAYATPKSPKKLGPALTAEQKKVATKYAAAMKRGRVATDKKDYAGAVHAFDDALALRKDDAQATAERGYAHLLAGDLDVAERDLHAAQPHAATATLAGMIWFNLGLIAEKRSNADAAKHAFSESNRLHPTKAAAGKLAGMTCTASLDTAPAPGAHYASWVEMDLALESAVTGPDALHPPKKADSEAAARKRLCDDGCPGRGPWIVAAKDSVDDPLLVTYAIVFAVRGQLVAHTGLGQRIAGRCSTTDEVELAADPSLVHVAATLEPNDMVDVDTSGDDVKPCGANADSCRTGCFYDDKTDVDAYFDPATGARLAEVTRPQTPAAGVELKVDEDFTQNAKLARTADGVAITGGGCDLHAALHAR